MHYTDYYNSAKYEGGVCHTTLTIRKAVFSTRGTDTAFTLILALIILHYTITLLWYSDFTMVFVLQEFAYH